MHTRQSQHGIGRIDDIFFLMAIAVGAPLGTYADAATLTFQEGVSSYASTADTFLAESDPATSKAALTVVEWDGDDPPSSGQSNYGLVRFDDIFGVAAGKIPAGSQITSATLTYTTSNAGTTGDLHEVAIS